MVDLSPRCVKCGEPLDVNSMRTLPDGSFMCAGCYDQKSKGFSGRNPSSETPRMKPRRRPSEATDAVASDEEVFKEKEYVCNECGYKFRRNSDFVVSVCPYCGKNDVQENIKKPADSLVNEQ
ncbi:MAG: hypothetical protein ACLFTH_04225 [Candidatus Woesearchaeota archaeon]